MKKLFIIMLFASGLIGQNLEFIPTQTQQKDLLLSELYMWIPKNIQYVEDDSLDIKLFCNTTADIALHTKKCGLQGWYSIFQKYCNIYNIPNQIIEVGHGKYTGGTFIIKVFLTEWKYVDLGWGCIGVLRDSRGHAIKDISAAEVDWHYFLLSNNEFKKEYSTK